MSRHFSPLSSSPKWCYDVFLSFRGEDTREGFTSHLYYALSKAGIFTFMDVRLKKGEQVSSELSLRIEESRFSIVVFSENYASSKWCLNELEKIKECKEKKGHQVIPVFYKVEPTEIRNQTGQTGEHLKKFLQDSEKVKRWRMALTDIANLSGWPFKERTETETKFIHDIVKDVSMRLNRKSLSIAHYPVGIEEHIKRIDPYLGIGSDDEVRIIGIYGGEWIGKSAIARAIVNYHGHMFEGISFLEGVKAAPGTYGLVKFQEILLYDILGDDSIRFGSSHAGASVIQQRLNSKKVLVVIDDVDDLEHLRLLAGGPEWFGPGSRIIITTQDKDVLQAYGVEHSYEMVGLEDVHATQLFCWNAFRKLNPPDIFVELSKNIVTLVQGIPGALIFIGSNLYGRNAEDWETMVAVIQDALNSDEVTGGWDEVRKIAIDGLSRPARAIFLVIAYILNGKDKEDIMETLDVPKSNFDVVIEDLTSKSLIRIQQNKVWVSDSLRELASKIIHAKSRIKVRLMRMLSYLDDATDELGDDMKSAAQSLYDEIFEDSDGDDDDDVIDEIASGIKSVAVTVADAGEEVLDKIVDRIDSFLDFFS